jgi:hypothetical protein
MWLRQRERQRERGTMTKRQIRFPQYCESIDPTSSVYVLLKVIQEQPPRHSKRGKKTGPRNVLCVPVKSVLGWPWSGVGQPHLELVPSILVSHPAPNVQI